MATLVHQTDPAHTTETFYAKGTSGNPYDEYFRIGSHASTNSESQMLPSGFEALSNYTGAGTSSSTYTEGFFLYGSGYNLLKVQGATTHNFNKRLTETVNGDHDVTVDYGDWKLTASNGSITVTVKQCFTITTTDCDIEFECLLGTFRKSDKRSTTESEGDYETYIIGTEGAYCFGYYEKHLNGSRGLGNTAFSYATTEVKGKTASISLTLFKIGTYLKSFSFLTGLGLSINAITGKLALVDGKKVVYYKKITPWQIYNTLAEGKTVPGLYTQKSTYDDKATGAAVRRKFFFSRATTIVDAET